MSETKVVPLTKQLVEHIDALSALATPGEWAVDPVAGSYGALFIDAPAGSSSVRVLLASIMTSYGSPHYANAEFIVDIHNAWPQLKAAALAHLRSQPAGYVSVPREPTKEMLQAGNDTGCFEDDYPRDSRREARTVYKAMLAASTLAGEGAMVIKDDGGFLP